MCRIKIILIAAILVILPALPAAGQNYEPWPEGWSDVVPLFNTSIFAGRFIAVSDNACTRFLSADGAYFKELDLTYRVARGGNIEEEIVIQTQAEISSLSLELDDKGRSYITWLEKLPDGNNSLNHTNFVAPDREHTQHSLLVTDNTVRDLATFQEGSTTHLVWSEWEDFLQIKYGQIKDNKLITSETITNNNDVSMRPTVVVNAQGHPCVAWMEADLYGSIGIYFSKKTADGWSRPLKVGHGSAQDVEQGGRISMIPNGDGISLAWASLFRASSYLFVHAAEIDSNLQVLGPTVLTMGSRPRLVKSNSDLQLVWQGQGQFGAVVRHAYIRNGHLEGDTNLVVGRTAAFRPEVLTRDGFVYVYWLQADAERGYNVHEINNQFPKPISLWNMIGIDENTPFYHLLYLLASTLMLAFAYLFGNLGFVLAGGVLYYILQRFNIYKEQGIFYHITLSAVILLVVRHLPIPNTSPEFYGLIHYALSAVLGIAGTYLFLRKVEQRGLFTTLAIVLMWQFLFLFFSLIPQTITS